MDRYDPSLLGVVRDRLAEGVTRIRSALPLLRPLPPGEIAPGSVLSPREMEILRLVIIGKTEREIAFRLFISVDGTSRQIAHIAKKLRVRRRDLPRVPLGAG